LAEGVDSRFDRIIALLGYIAPRKPSPVIDSVMFWRKSKSEVASMAALEVERAIQNSRQNSQTQTQLLVPGLPEQVKAIAGVSAVENWGRWSDANLAPSVKIDYVKPLPTTFDVVIRARAYGSNIDKPVSVRVGDQEQFVSFGDKDGTVKVQFTNPGAAQSIVITPPSPTEPTEGTSGGFQPRKLGIGMVSLEVQPVEPES